MAQTQTFTALKDNALYQKISPRFNSAGFTENITVTQGFVLGLAARGYSASESRSLELTIDLLNAGASLNGTGIALFTSLMIESERDLKNNHFEPFIPALKERSNAERIKALADLAYGFQLGLCGESEPVISSIMDAEYTHKNREFKECLHFIESVVQIDENSSFSEDDFQLVCTELHNNICRIAELIRNN